MEDQKMPHGAMEPAVGPKEYLQTQGLEVQKMLSEAMEPVAGIIEYLKT